MRFRNEKGQSMVEFALLLPILITILLAIIEFGFMFNAYLSLTNGAREGARLGSVGGNDAAIVTRVEDVTSHLDPLLMNIAITPAFRSRGDMITVTVNYDYQFITPFIGGILNPIVDLEAETKMRVE